VGDCHEYIIAEFIVGLLKKT